LTWRFNNVENGKVLRHYWTSKCDHDQPDDPRHVTSRCSAQRSGAPELAAWLKYIENRSPNAPDQNDLMATYDLTWLWRKLKVEQLRN
jgi:hypothetical protein